MMMTHVYKEDDSGKCDNAEHQIRHAVVISALYLRCVRLEYRPGDGPCWLTVFGITLNLRKNKLWIVL
jgi:hypothetical protein